MRLTNSIIIISDNDFLYSCGKNEEVYQPVKIQDPYVIYKEAMDAFDKREYFFAEKNFHKQN